MKAITPHYIDGKVVEPHGREVMDSINPTNNTVIGRVMLADEEDTKRAIDSAKHALASFGGRSKEERAAILLRLHEVVKARIDDLTDAMVEEYRGVHRFSNLIVQMAADSFFQAEKALQELPLVRTWNKTSVSLIPVGVAGLITAWNSNALFICLKTASALAAGCTVVVKPSELSSFQTQVLIECVHEAKLPRGVFSVVTGLGSTVGAELVRNLDVAKISFTGSVAVGQQIMRDGAATMKRVTLELGGKSPNILLDDVNLDEAIPRALAIAFLNSGQACAAGARLLVPRSRLEEIKQRIVAVMANMPVGDPNNNDTAIGPMVTRTQYERVESHIQKGIEEGAEVLVGGEGHPEGFEAGNFVKPTIFVNVTNDMTMLGKRYSDPS